MTAERTTGAGVPVPRQEQSAEGVEQERVHELRRRLEALLGIPATEGNALTVLRNGDRIFPAMLQAVREATETIDFLTFVYWKGDIARDFALALAERATAGVRVRVLIDAVGGRLIDRSLIGHMADCGVQVEWFRAVHRTNPLKQNHRTHRKVLICDERVGFTGGVGIAQEWCGDARDEREWRDTHVRVEGPAVDGLSASFAQNWAETGHALIEERRRFPDHGGPGTSVVQVARGSASVGWNDMATVFRVMIESSQTRLRMMTAYFVPDDCFQQLLLDAVARGVEVDVMLPGPHADKRVCQLASESIYSDARRGRRADLGVPAVDAARQGHDGGRHRQRDRLGQHEPPLDAARRGGRAHRSRPRGHPAARGRLRRRAAALRADLPAPLAGPAAAPEGAGEGDDRPPPVPVGVISLDGAPATRRPARPSTCGP